jgi:heme/copper-type cytochrome/quinol oxidase subunit 2
MNTLIFITLVAFVCLGLVILAFVAVETRRLLAEYELKQKRYQVEATYAQRKYLFDLRTRLGWSTIGIHEMDIGTVSEAISQAKEAINNRYRVEGRSIQEDDGEPG